VLRNGIREFMVTDKIFLLHRSQVAKNFFLPTLKIWQHGNHHFLSFDSPLGLVDTGKRMVLPVPGLNLTPCLLRVAKNGLVSAVWRPSELHRKPQGQICQCGLTKLEIRQ
jgi:hypothetical protein